MQRLGCAAVATSTQLAAVLRVVGLTGADGMVNTSTLLNTFSAFEAYAQLVTSNGYDIWATGGNNGIRYAAR